MPDKVKLSITFHLTISRQAAEAGSKFDLPEVVKRLKEWFPAAEINTEDRIGQLTERGIAEMEMLIADGQQRQKMVQQARSQSSQRGPVYEFEIPVAEIGHLHGSMEAKGISVSFPAEVPAELQLRMRQFLEMLQQEQLRQSES